MFEGLMKKVGLEFGFGRWAYLNEWREGISRKATYVSCTKCFPGGILYQQISILLGLKHCTLKFQEGSSDRDFAHQKLTLICSIQSGHWLLQCDLEFKLNLDKFPVFQLWG